jgi:hypothetical protein
MMNWKGRERKRSWPNVRYYPGVCFKGLRKTTKNLSHYSRSPSLDAVMNMKACGTNSYH